MTSETGTSLEDSLNDFLSYRADTLISQNQLFSDSMGQISKDRQSSVSLLAFYTTNICVKFRDDSLEGFQVIEQTRFCDIRTDRRRVR